MTAPTQETIEAFLASFSAEIARQTALQLQEQLAEPARLLTVEQAAGRLGVTDRTVRRLVERGQLASVLVGDGARRIESQALDSYIAERRTQKDGDDG